MVVVVEDAPDLVDAWDQAVVRDGNLWPDGLHQLAPSGHPPGVERGYLSTSNDCGRSETPKPDLLRIVPAAESTWHSPVASR